MWDNFVQTLTDMWGKFSTDPTQQTHALLGGILLMLGTLVMRRKARIKHTFVAPPGTKATLKIGDDK